MIFTKKIYDAGHEIGNHSYTHPHMAELSEAEILSELYQTQQLLDQITGGNEGLKLFRFPYGSKNGDAVRLVENQGFIPVTWTVDSKDWTGISAEQVYDNVMRSEHLEHGAIILMHTSGEHTLEALDLLIPSNKTLFVCLLYSPYLYFPIVCGIIREKYAR
ncbi:MAG: polysaccharide deacetylase family protein [Lachnospiraceae bacterium]|nr:polysaccharide deacetylase family protein [Lachnospiraceae bacterium]